MIAKLMLHTHPSLAVKVKKIVMTVHGIILYVKLGYIVIGMLLKM